MLHALPAAPEAAIVPGVVFRHPSGEADADALHEVHTGRMVHDGLDPFSTERELPRREDVLAMLNRLAEQGQLDRVLVAEAGGCVAGYTRITSWREADDMVVMLILGWVLPEWRGKGIGTALLRWGERRARQLADSDYRGQKFEFAANASRTEHDATALLLHEGYSVAYTVLEMEWEPGPLSVSPLPPGLELRPALPEHCGQIAASVYEAYSNEYPEHRFQEVPDFDGYAVDLAGSKYDRSLWHIAWNGDEIAGQVLSEIRDNRGEVFELSVRAPWRRKGLGRALMSRAVRSLVDRGVDAIRLGTVAEFPTRACDLYRSLGYRVVKEFPRYRKPASA